MKPSYLLVEGKDDKQFFQQLALVLGIGDKLEVEAIHGRNNLRKTLRGLVKEQDLPQVLGIVMDADDSAEKTFQEIVETLKNIEDIELPVPKKPLVRSEGSSPFFVTVMIMPDTSGRMLEDLFLELLKSDPVLGCIEDFLKCIQAQNIVITDNDIPKFKMRSYFASRVGIDIFSIHKWDMKEIEWEHPVFDTSKEFLRGLVSV
jgi:5S rRNA maturation endonuclease (ribonuclease M5)